MPYITQNRREALNPALYGVEPETAGELNFVFTRVILEYLKLRKESYQTYNDVIGALEGCKLELYRRRVARMEDGKIVTNGDVY